jgi:hypothetical protein
MKPNNAGAIVARMRRLCFVGTFAGIVMDFFSDQNTLLKHPFFHGKQEKEAFFSHVF